MKIAFLIDVHSERADLLRQRIEDSINSVGARLIYSTQSFGPIRIVHAENEKYPPAYTPLPIPKRGRQVNDASDIQGNLPASKGPPGNSCRSLCRHGHRHYRSRGHRLCLDGNVENESRQVRSQRNNVGFDGADGSAVAHQRGNPAYARLLANRAESRSGGLITLPSFIFGSK